MLIANAPTTALDVSVRAQILDLPLEPQRDEGMAMVFISHNLAVISQVADEVMVMYAGRVIEHGPTQAVLTAHAKGIPLPRLILRHALRNAMIPVVTIIALGPGNLFSGAPLTETIFTWNGMGRLILQAIMGNDYNLAMVCLLFTTAAILAANILADIAYTSLDPRIALEERRR